MIEEIQLLNHWLSSSDGAFLFKNNIDRDYFIVLKEVREWVESFYQKHNKLPSPETVAIEFDDFKLVSDPEPIDYLISVLKQQKAYMEYRPCLIHNAKMVEEGKTLEAIMTMKTNVDNLLKTYTGSVTKYDWVKDATKRYEKYLEKHGKDGLQGLTTGIKGLDALTGGWKSDDLILLAGRTNEGKSITGGYFAYHAWRSLKIAGIKSPVIYITTEMPELEIAYRLDTLKAHFSNTSLNNGKLSDPELYREYLEELQRSDNNFLILSESSNGGRPFTPNDIRAVIESERPAFVVVDQLYDLCDGTGERDIRRKIVNVTNQIRDINLNTQTPMMLIAQAGRDSAKENKKDPEATPELFHIQESDNPAQKATRVITLRLIGGDKFKMSLKKNRGGAKDKDIIMKVDIDTGIWEETPIEAQVF